MAALDLDICIIHHAIIKCKYENKPFFILIPTENALARLLHPDWLHADHWSHGHGIRELLFGGMA